MCAGDFIRFSIETWMHVCVDFYMAKMMMICSQKNAFSFYHILSVLCYSLILSFHIYISTDTDKRNVSLLRSPILNAPTNNIKQKKESLVFNTTIKLSEKIRIYFFSFRIR